jgi:hypothetical protein
MSTSLLISGDVIKYFLGVLFIGAVIVELIDGIYTVCNQLLFAHVSFFIHLGQTCAEGHWLCAVHMYIQKQHVVKGYKIIGCSLTETFHCLSINMARITLL